MKQTTVYVAASLAITMILLQPTRAQSSQYEVDFNHWVDRLREILRWRPKRDCMGYMCSYHHMGAAAAQRSKHKSLMLFLKSCAMDPSCSPGKRRKRSVRNLSSLSRSGVNSRTTHYFTLRNAIPGIYSKNLKRNRKENVKSFSQE